MIGTLVFLHRWLGVAFCLLFAIWFASGVVMHFVPYPSFTAADRRAGLAPIDLAQVKAFPSEALAASRIENTARVRLAQRSDGPIYLISSSSRTIALHAADLSEAAVASAKQAIAIASDYAMRRQWDAPAAGTAGLGDYDQWTLSAELDAFRPLYRIALSDASGTNLYVSKITGEVVLVTTSRQRAWNYVGSVAHWIYLTALRSHPMAWSGLLWWLSLFALIGAALGACVGILRIKVQGSHLISPYAGIHAWHHWLGLCCMLFVLTWSFSGWLSMDDGTMFSTDKPSDREIAAVAGAPDWNAIPRDEAQHLNPQTIEADWFAFGGRIYRRQIGAHGDQSLAIGDAFAGEPAAPEHNLLDSGLINATARQLAPSCAPAVTIEQDDAYAMAPTSPAQRVFRLICGDDWFDIDAANGALLDKLDGSHRVYRWLFGRLHRLDFPVLARHPTLHTYLVVALCGCGFTFSLTGVVLGWRRLRRGGLA
jgi:PepSY-associated TM region